MPKKFPEEFKRDVVRVARRGDLTHAEVAADFDISVELVRRWVRQADTDDGVVAGQTSSEQRAREAASREAPSGDGERDLAPRGGLLRRWQPTKMSHPLVRVLAAEGIPVRLTCGVLDPGLVRLAARAGEPARPRGRLLHQPAHRRLRRRPGVQLPAARRRARARRREGRRAAGLAVVQPAEALVSDRAQGPPGQDARAGRARRPGDAFSDRYVRASTSRPPREGAAST